MQIINKLIDFAGLLISMMSFSKSWTKKVQDQPFQRLFSKQYVLESPKALHFMQQASGDFPSWLLLASVAFEDTAHASTVLAEQPQHQHRIQVQGRNS